MLDAESEPTIRFAIMRRLDAEPGVEICDLQIRPNLADSFIAVGMVARLGKLLIADAQFHLPIPFEIGHLHNEIDEIAEGFKKARHDFFKSGMRQVERKQLSGTGLRGRWAQYG